MSEREETVVAAPVTTDPSQAKDVIESRPSGTTDSEE